MDHMDIEFNQIADFEEAAELLRRSRLAADEEVTRKVREMPAEALAMEIVSSRRFQSEMEAIRESRLTTAQYATRAVYEGDSLPKAIGVTLGPRDNYDDARRQADKCERYSALPSWASRALTVFGWCAVAFFVAAAIQGWTK